MVRSFYDLWDSPDLSKYQRIIVAFSGGKDSAACVLHLLDLGADPAAIELWHHVIDDPAARLRMDWPSTTAYCRAFAAAFGLRLYLSGKAGGFEGEMLRKDALTAPTWFETPEGIRTAGGERGKRSTRRRFPQVSPDLSVRWCSAYLKIMVAATAICNQERFFDGATLFVTGERAEESTNRARYASFEPHKCATARRRIDHWRPVLSWSEAEVWDILRRWRVDPAPAYKLGWSRLSCMCCIFGNAQQWSNIQAIAPDTFEQVAEYEAEFGCTVRKGVTVRDLAAQATPFPMDPADVALALSEVYDAPIILPEGQEWTLPAGAFGSSSCGPS